MRRNIRECPLNKITDCNLRNESLTRMTGWQMLIKLPDWDVGGVSHHQRTNDTAS